MELLEVVTWMGAAAQVYQRGRLFLVQLAGIILITSVTRPTRDTILQAIEEAW